MRGASTEQGKCLNCSEGIKLDESNVMKQLIYVVFTERLEMQILKRV